jgi:hypothetical protein
LNGPISWFYNPAKQYPVSGESGNFQRAFQANLNNRRSPQNVNNYLTHEGQSILAGEFWRTFQSLLELSTSHTKWAGTELSGVNLAILRGAFQSLLELSTTHTKWEQISRARGVEHFGW